MTLRNRVLPTAEIAALDYRGLFMGNRGRLHDDAREIVRPWNLTAWLICAAEFKGRRRTLMAPGCYTELFFLDEAHALAAGHRPCFECRRAAFHAFLAAASCDGAKALDEALHGERLTGRHGMRRASRPPRRQALHADELPPGAMALVGDTAFARRPDGWIAWSREAPGAYLAALDGGAARDTETLRTSLHKGEALTILTPPTTLRALRGGYAPVWHPSADGAERV